MAFDKTRTYSPADVKIVYGGVEMTGFADSSFVTIEFAADSFTKKVGADGSVTRIRVADDSGSVTIKLLQSSSSNEILTALMEADRAGLTGALPIIVKDANGTSLYTCGKAWVSTRPSVDYSNDVGTLEWKIDCDHLAALFGSSNAL